MLVVVTTVSTIVHAYSIGYMHDDPSRPRFFSYLSLFTFAMLMLVTSDNLVQMFFGWEGVGLASYLLIGFWYTRPTANAAAIKAFVVNRVGDFGFSLGIFLVFALTKSVSFDTIFAAAPGLAGKTYHAFGLDADAVTLACLLLFMGAMGKSAQFLLHTWLPDAMEGPTPVSALIHAATMVTAGVFMVARLSPLFEMSADRPDVRDHRSARITCFFAATDRSRAERHQARHRLFDLLAARLHVRGARLRRLCDRHLPSLHPCVLQGVCCSLGAGSVIHAVGGEQDMRRMGGLASKIPVTFWLMVIGTLALTGFPFTAGYYSKDAIIEAAYASQRGGAAFGWLMTTVAAGLTSFYSWRLIFMTFFGASRAEVAHEETDHNTHHEPGDTHQSGGAPSGHEQAAVTQDTHASPATHGDHGHGHGGEPHESPPIMLYPLYVLAFGALFAGLLFHHVFIGGGREWFWGEALFYGASNHVFDDMEHVPWFVSALPSLMFVLGLGVAYYAYVMHPGTADRWAKVNPPLYRFLLNKWYFDELYDILFVRPAFWLGRLFWKQGDGRIIDGFGPDGVAQAVLATTDRVVKIQTGYVYHYAFAMMLGVAAFITWYLVGGVR